MLSASCNNLHPVAVSLALRRQRPNSQL
ncbi:hypothetical protein NP493_5985g00000 [Ridgeia piscesae]|uniref:Uncharacterized protein n=1 Tax=Ridgeia piscesae TaxID=27915 RepID=A0AAD9ISB0_RIDPI|nr:hypothetical protein NP493_5985g00000 [Ridgeia piscesae]